MSSPQRELISRAAAVTDKSESEFVLDAAVTAAERALADRRWFETDPRTFEQFQALLDAPVPYEEDLTALLHGPTVFES